VAQAILAGIDRLSLVARFADGVDVPIKLAGTEDAA